MFRVILVKIASAYSIPFWITIVTLLILASKSSIKPVIILMLFAVPIIFLILSHFIKLFGYKKFDSKAHGKKMKEYSDNVERYPTVDIFLPICGEDIGIIEKTWKSVNNLNYKNKIVYVLDDGKSGEAKELAQTYGFKYLTRDDSAYKKAGNLRNGFKNSEGEFVAIFDADFCPEPNFLTNTLPYMEGNTAIVQTPQGFKGGKDLEWGSGNIQRFFYEVVQPSKDSFEAAICVGTNALYRRKALNEIGGGTYLIEHPEDVWTGFALTAAGWKVKYLPITLAYGNCPDETYSFFKQQTRWCQGSTSLASSSFFWKAKISLAQRLCYLSGFMFYIYSLAILTLPVITIIMFNENRAS